MITAVTSFFQKIIGSLVGKNIWFHALAIILTYLLVVSGFDWFYFTHTQIPAIQSVAFVAVALGGLLPILLPPPLYIVGKIRKQNFLQVLSLALLQAAVIGSIISSAYKAFTGRIQPDRLNTVLDISHNFQFGFFNHGIFWGWPSSHTTIAFAMAVTLIYLFPKHKSVFYGALFYAFYIGLGISVNIHWFSEFVAGALIGTAIGISVGKSYSNIISKYQ